MVHFNAKDSNTAG
jgi:hypothetical protein